jgi:hypothetical protein
MAFKKKILNFVGATLCGRPIGQTDVSAPTKKRIY